MGLSLSLTAVIFMIWVSVQTSGSGVVVAKEEPRDRGESPIAVLRSSVAQAYESFRGFLSETEEAINLQVEYEKIRDQVEKGEIKITPEGIER